MEIIHRISTSKVDQALELAISLLSGNSEAIVHQAAMAEG